MCEDVLVNGSRSMFYPICTQLCVHSESLSIGAGMTNLVYTPLDSWVIELIPYTWRSPEYEHLSAATGRSYRFWRNTHKEKHIEPDCREMAGRNSAEEPNICRTGTSATLATVSEIRTVVEEAVQGVLASRRRYKEKYSL